MDVTALLEETILTDRASVIDRGPLPRLLLLRVNVFTMIRRIGVELRAQKLTRTTKSKGEDQ